MYFHNPLSGLNSERVFETLDGFLIDKQKSPFNVFVEFISSISGRNLKRPAEIPIGCLVKFVFVLYPGIQKALLNTKNTFLL
jgi:hypothetical protein